MRMKLLLKEKKTECEAAVAKIDERLTDDGADEIEIDADVEEWEIWDEDVAVLDCSLWRNMVDFISIKFSHRSHHIQ